MIVITGFQRSGTTALGELLGTLDGVAYFGEVFHPVAVEDAERARALRVRAEANYWRISRAAEGSERFRDPADTIRMHERWAYFVHQLTCVISPAEEPVIDIKYNSWCNLTPVWHGLEELPYMLDLVLRSPIPIIHVVRENLFAQSMSESIAENQGVYHRTTAELGEPQPEPVELLPATVILRMRQSVRQTKKMREWLKGRALEVRYERLFSADSLLRPAAARSIGSAIGRDMGGLRPVLRKSASSMRAKVCNYDEVVDALTRTEFAARMPLWTGRAQP